MIGRSSEAIESPNGLTGLMYLSCLSKPFKSSVASLYYFSYFRLETTVICGLEEFMGSGIPFCWGKNSETWHAVLCRKAYLLVKLFAFGLFYSYRDEVDIFLIIIFFI